jgi:uncharacterized protein
VTQPLQVARRLSAAAGVAAILMSVTARGQSLPALPALTAPVNDFAHVIDAASARDLDTRIRALQAASGDVVVVATVPTIEGYGSIEEYALRLFEQAKIGQKDKDNGLLIVVAVKEHKVKIEVGYGLEEYVTDGFAGDTIRQAMLPDFRRGDYGPGLLAGATRLITRIADRRGVTVANVPRQVPTSSDGGGGAFPVFPIIVVIIIVLLMLRRRRGGPRGPFSGWTGGVGPFGGGFGGGLGGGFGRGGFGGGGFGGGGGGFGGFGGGRSGGGGASGGW